MKKLSLVVDHHFDMAQHVYTLFSGLYTRLLYTSLYILVMDANKKSTDCMKKVEGESPSQDLWLDAEPNLWAKTDA